MNSTTSREPFEGDSRSRPSRKVHLIFTQVVLIIVTVIVVSLRIWVRKTIRAFGSDDWLILVSLLFAISFTLCTCLSTRYGWTYHIIDVHDTLYLLNAAWVAELIFTPTVSLVKASILVFYLRLSSNRAFRQAVFAGLVFIALWFIVFEILIAMTCHSPADPVGFNGARTNHCVKSDPTPIFHGTTNIVSDFYVLVLPMRLVWNLKMPRKRRIGLMCLFAAGVIVCIFGTLRLVWAILTNASKDFTWNGFHVWLWASLELDLGIICASLPALKPLIVKLIPSCDFTPSEGAGDPEQRGPRQILPKIAKGQRVTMRFSAIKGGEPDVRNFWISDVASPSEEKVVRCVTRIDADLEQGEGNGSVMSTTQESGEIEIAPNQGIRKTVEFRLEHVISGHKTTSLDGNIMEQ